MRSVKLKVMTNGSYTLDNQQSSVVDETHHTIKNVPESVSMVEVLEKAKQVILFECFEAEYKDLNPGAIIR